MIAPPTQAFCSSTPAAGAALWTAVGSGVGNTSSISEDGGSAGVSAGIVGSGGTGTGSSTPGSAQPATGGGASNPLLEQLPLLEDSVHLQGAVKIGSGSLGVVLLVQDRQFPARRLAVKVISLKLVRDTGHEEDRVWREVQVMRDIDHHPNLVQLVDVFACWNRVPHVASDPPHVCIAMEYVSDSEPLSNVLRRCGPSVQLASQVLPQLTDALALLHHKGLVHRDVWSENVLVCGHTGHAVLVDLGCAEYIGSELAVNSKLNIPYMSPEAARGLRQAPCDDCWALGLLLTEMLTGRFVAHRLGRSDLPIHYNLPALAEALQEAVVEGGVFLGGVCSQLLEVAAGQRLSMPELATRWRRESQIQSGACVAVARGAPCWGNGPMRAVSWQTAPSVVQQQQHQHQQQQQHQHSPEQQPTPPQSFFVPHPRLALMPSRARTQASSALVSSGATLSPASLPSMALDSNLAAARSSTSSVECKSPVSIGSTGGCCHAAGSANGSTNSGGGSGCGYGLMPSQYVQYRPRQHNAVFVGRVQKGVALQQLRLDTSTTSEEEQVEVRAAAASGARGAATVASGTMSTAMAPVTIVCNSSTRLCESGNSGSLVTSTGLIALATGRVAAGMPALPPELAAGLRVAYTARSNGQRYLGVILGRLSSRNGWHIALDVGENKEVDDSEAWRLQLVPAG
mmetsp:Transcript_56845/g.163186  ORF Transcript_56845/g.163186 Transcript_56845/m.163186 type:complete len:683 (+) Transcript_56845:102-2150(+)